MASPPRLCGPVSSQFGVSYGVPKSEGKIIENFVSGKRYYEHEMGGKKRISTVLLEAGRFSVVHH